ncbi:hypothetical protein RSAG8_02501, partial [Rhizoctonia solani AG-8 WAC10335]
MDASRLFDKIKPLCTSLFKSPSPAVLATLYQTLQSAPRSAFTPSLIEYTFFPISHLLRKPPIPNHLLEQIFLCLSVLCAHWDLSHSPGIWAQLVILCNLAEGKDEETRLAACLTLHALFPNLAALEPRNLPIVGKTLDTLLGYALSPNHALQTTSLEVLLCIVETFPLDHVPAVLPGVVSKMVRVAMGDKTTSRAIGLALAVLGKVLERGIGDEVCIESGAIRDYTTLDDLVAPTPEGPTHSGGRTPTWLGATAPQVHISLLSLSPLSTHPNPLTRRALVELCTTLTQSCVRTLDHSQPLLVSHLLLLAYPALALEHAVPEDAQKALDSLKSVDVRVVAGIVAKALSLLPHRLSHTHQSTASALSKQLVSACHVLPSSTVGALLGPGGGIEKWGRTLLAVIRFDSSEYRIVPLLQQLTSSDPVEEVQPRLEGLDLQTTNDIASLFRALGKRAGDQGVFAIEWFVSAGVGGSVAGLWCALWLLRGIQSNPERPSTRVLKASKWIAKALAEMWDDQFLPAPIVQEERLEVTEYVKGLNPLTTLLDRPSQPRKTNAREDKRLHSDMAIRLIVTCHTILANSAPTLDPPKPPHPPRARRAMYNTHPILRPNTRPLAAFAIPEDAQKALDSLKSVDVRAVAGIVVKALSLLPHRLSHTHQSTASALSKQLVSACHVLPSSTVGVLLGPGGGIEKWGRTLLAVIRFDSTEHRIVPLLQQLTSSDPVEEVQPRLEGLDTQTTNDIASLFRALGKRAGDQGVFAIEWFVSAGVGGSVAGLWCALWLLRGIQSNPERPSTRVLKASKWIAKTLAEMWDDQFLSAPIVQEERLEVTEYVKGLNPLTTLLDRPSQPRKTNAREDKRLHSDMAIRLIVTCHTILANSAPTISPSTNPTYSSSIAVNPSITLLQYTIYPMLVQAKGLNEVSAALGYARMENMLLANFDYALEAVARRVSVFGVYAAGLQHTPSTTSPSISIQALSTLRTLVHLIGSQIVSRASDVIDECFDRLDDFHGYERVVGALVGVLAEVVEVVGREDDGSARDFEREAVGGQEYEGWEGFLKWWNARGKEHNWESDEEEPKPEPDEPPPLPPT